MITRHDQTRNRLKLVEANDNPARRRFPIESYSQGPAPRGLAAWSTTSSLADYLERLRWKSISHCDAFMIDAGFRTQPIGQHGGQKALLHSVDGILAEFVGEDWSAVINRRRILVIRPAAIDNVATETVGVRLLGLLQLRLAEARKFPHISIGIAASCNAASPAGMVIEQATWAAKQALNTATHLHVDTHASWSAIYDTQRAGPRLVATDVIFRPIGA